MMYWVFKETSIIFDFVIIQNDFFLKNLLSFQGWKSPYLTYLFPEQ